MARSRCWPHWRSCGSQAPGRSSLAQSATGIARLPLLLGAAALALSAVALFTPALTARAQGGLEGGFDATWAMFGYESASSWLVFAAAGLALAAAFLLVQTRPRERLGAVGRRGARLRGRVGAARGHHVATGTAGYRPTSSRRTAPSTPRSPSAGRLDVVRLIAMALAVAAVVALAVVAAARPGGTGWAAPGRVGRTGSRRCAGGVAVRRDGHPDRRRGLAVALVARAASTRCRCRPARASSTSGAGSSRKTSRRSLCHKARRGSTASPR